MGPFLWDQMALALPNGVAVFGSLVWFWVRIPLLNLSPQWDFGWVKRPWLSELEKLLAKKWPIDCLNLRRSCSVGGYAPLGNHPTTTSTTTTTKARRPLLRQIDGTKGKTRGKPIVSTVSFLPFLLHENATFDCRLGSFPKLNPKKLFLQLLYLDQKKESSRYRLKAPAPIEAINHPPNHARGSLFFPVWFCLSNQCCLQNRAGNTVGDYLLTPRSTGTQLKKTRFLD